MGRRCLELGHRLTNKERVDRYKANNKDKVRLFTQIRNVKRRISTLYKTLNNQEENMETNIEEFREVIKLEEKKIEDLKSKYLLIKYKLKANHAEKKETVQSNNFETYPIKDENYPIEPTINENDAIELINSDADNAKPNRVTPTTPTKSSLPYLADLAQLASDHGDILVQCGDGGFLWSRLLLASWSLG